VRNNKSFFSCYKGTAEILRLFSLSLRQSSPDDCATDHKRDVVGKYSKSEVCTLLRMFTDTPLSSSKPEVKVFRAALVIPGARVESAHDVQRPVKHARSILSCKAALLFIVFNFLVTHSCNKIDILSPSVGNRRPRSSSFEGSRFPFLPCFGAKKKVNRTSTHILPVPKTLNL
jgi:hypothetical protein